MPKLLFYTHGLVGGGGERLWACLASALKARGHDVIFAQDFEATENRGNLDRSIPLHTLGRGHARAVRNLARLLAVEQPDVAFSAVGGSNLKLMLAMALARSRTRAVITCHGRDEWKTGALSLASHLTLPAMSRAAARTVAVSDGLRDHLIARWFSAPAKTIAIHNPVFYPAGIRAPDARELARRDNEVLAMGRLVPEKDFTTLIAAFAAVKTPGARLTIAGEGPERARLEAMVRELGLQAKVTLAGYAPDPWQLYAKAKCFVLSSRSEMFGNVVVEALAHGLPVVSTAALGPREILAEGAHGTLVPIGDRARLASAIEAALAAPGDPAPRLVRAAQFSFPVRVPAYEALIADVLSQSGVGARQAPAAA